MSNTAKTMPHGTRSQETSPGPRPFEKPIYVTSPFLPPIEEFAAGPVSKKVKEPERLKKIFAHIDADGDGKVTLKEFQQAREKRQQRAGGKKGKRGPGDKGNGMGKGKPGPGGMDKK